MKTIRSKAPLRLGLAGGGTDVSPYSDMFGGAVLNATINKYAYASIEPLDRQIIELRSYDLNVLEEFEMNRPIPESGVLKLLQGTYNRIARDFGPAPSGFRLHTFVDAPAGSGLGSSSTLVVAIIGAFVEWMHIPLGEYEIAHLAWSIEREDLGLAGGKQDQYAATFGGFNFMEFYKDDKVIVNPLRIKQRHKEELQHNLLLFYTGTSRESARIIEKQSHNIASNEEKALEATHQLKHQANRMKEALLTGTLDDVGAILHHGWENKKNMASGISNNEIDFIYLEALRAGASGGKISGAGGGGFMLFYCPGNSRYLVLKALKKLEGQLHPYEFTSGGLYTYSL